MQNKNSNSQKAQTQAAKKNRDKKAWVNNIKNFKKRPHTQRK